MGAEDLAALLSRADPVGANAACGSPGPDLDAAAAVDSVQTQLAAAGLAPECAHFFQCRVALMDLPCSGGGMLASDMSTSSGTGTGMAAGALQPEQAAAMAAAGAAQPQLRLAACRLSRLAMQVRG